MKNHFFPLVILLAIWLQACSQPEAKLNASIPNEAQALHTDPSGYRGGLIKDLKVDENATHFLVMGDWGRRGQFNQQAVADRMGEAGYQLDIEFVVATGDNFYPNGVASIHDPNWRYSYEDIYTDHSLYAPWYVVLGNHDYRGNPQAQIDYTHISQRWNMPDRFWADEWELEDEKGKMLMVYLDTNPFEKKYYTEKKYRNVSAKDTAYQKQWADSVLSTSDADWKIVVGHHPLYSNGKRKGECGPVRGSIQPLLDKNKVDVYFCGHEHDLQHIKPEGHPTHCVVSGAGSEIRPTGEPEGQYKFSVSNHGFVAVSVTSEKLFMQFINHEGKILYTYQIDKQQKN